MRKNGKEGRWKGQSRRVRRSDVLQVSLGMDCGGLKEPQEGGGHNPGER